MAASSECWPVLWRSQQIYNIPASSQSVSGWSIGLDKYGKSPQTHTHRKRELELQSSCSYMKLWGEFYFCAFLFGSRKSIGGMYSDQKKKKEQANPSLIKRRRVLKLQIRPINRWCELQSENRKSANIPTGWSRSSTFWMEIVPRQSWSVNWKPGNSLHGRGFRFWQPACSSILA